MDAKENALPHSYGSDFARVDAHEIEPEEYEEIPEMGDEMISLGTLKIGDQTIYSYPQQLLTLPLPPEIFERWIATGPGWQARMTALLSKI
ncbi:hypothetical protein ACXZ1M_04170 [Duganella sp. PWIR1]|jgi:uncharacterized protein (DUF4415 family)